ncbi:unnamed protein product [Alopecurus aequalis]
MPPFRRWADLPPELLCRIGDILDDLKCYGSARGACTAWRRALAPPCPSLLLVPDDARSCRPSAASLPTRRCFDLKTIPSGARCVGSSNGWLALSVDDRSTFFSLFNPITGAEITLPPLIYKGWWASKSKLVFAPDPAGDDFAAAVICDKASLAYVTAGARRWAVLDPVLLTPGDHFTDAVYNEKAGKGSVYCLTHYGDVHVLRLPERRRREPITVGKPSSRLSLPADADQQHDMSWRRYIGPDLNAPATVAPLLSLPFDPATGFAAPYNTVSAFTSVKNLVFCEGNLYQVWRNASCTVTVKLPGGGRRRVAENEVLVLRYYPRRRPCWDAVDNLGGYSVFLGRNNAASMYAQGGRVQGLEGNCVYWIGGRGRDQGMVFDMATGRTTACRLPAALGVAPQSTFCWYLLSDSCNYNGGKRVYQTRARVRANREKQEDSMEE